MTLDQTTATLVAAVISSAVAILAVVLRDVILEHRKEIRRLRRELIEKQLTEIYSPLWVAAGSGVSLSFLDNKALLTRIEAYFHLLSPELQDIINKLLVLNPNSTVPGWRRVYFRRGDDGSVIEEGDEILHDFIYILRADMKELQGEYSSMSRRAPWRSRRVPRRFLRWLPSFKCKLPFRHQQFVSHASRVMAFIMKRITGVSS